MDPAVLAAIIPTPVALLATAAAYAAGRVQGRAAYRGPVDAVRRQHQRDAYATFLSAANEFWDQTDWGPCLDEARGQVGIRAFFGDMDESTREEVERRATQIRRAVPVKPLRAAAAVIALEGPEEVADRANMVLSYAWQLRSESEQGPAHVLRALARGEPVPPGPTVRSQLLTAMEAFTSAARAHLNGEGSSGA